MKTYKKSIFKFTTAFLFVLAMVLPSNMSAAGHRDRDGRSGHRDRDGRRGNVDGDYTGETGYHDDNAGNCGHGPNQHAGNACGGTTDSIPLDGGLGILVLGAAAFGVRKLRG